VPFAELAKALDVDVVIGATYYSSCVGLIQAFSDLEYFPRSLAVAACIGAPSLYNDVGKDLRWISGPSQVLPVALPSPFTFDERPLPSLSLEVDSVECV
jgi:hypothetical protein